MIRRLMEQSYFGITGNATAELVQFWLRELRTPELLIEVAAEYPELARAEASSRPAVQAAQSGRLDEVSEVLEAEERQERRKDREYWLPLKRELFVWGEERNNSRGPTCLSGRTSLARRPGDG